jgi:hypothetical protein
MSNGEVCCILGVCCPPAQRRVKVFQAMSETLNLTPADADAVTDWFIDHVTPQKMTDAMHAELAKHAKA